jgi:4-aminobutyrate aminotransferase-like enzyme
MLPEIIVPPPGSRSLALAAKLRAYEARGVTLIDPEFPIFWERAEGANVWDADGNRYLDFTGAFAVANLGHTAPAVRDAAIAQAGIMLHAMGDVHPASLKADLCESLSRITFERWGLGAGKTFLANSGSEAVEAALKTALLHSGKPGVISFTGGYHGLGYGALEAVGIDYFRAPFRAQSARFGVQLPYPHCYRCPFECRDGFRLEGSPFPNCSTPCLEKLRSQIAATIEQREIGCILVEPIQGRGGEITPPRDFLRILREICDEYKVLLILDEIYTGFHRTGKFFACEHFGVFPDIICLGKALTGGFPLAACAGRSDIMDAWPASSGEALHTSTMLGNPVGCAMALASIREHEKDTTAAAARRTGRTLRLALEALSSPHIGQVRGVGSMLGVELIKTDGSPFPQLSVAIMYQGLKDGLILLGGGPAGNVLSFSPPFVVSEDEIGYLREKLQEYLMSLPGSIS